MNINISNSFNFDTIIESIASISYTTGDSTTLTSSQFSIVQNDLEPNLILDFTDSASEVINFASTANIPNYTILSTLGFNTTLQNQINKTTTQMTVTYDARLDTQCQIVIDSEQMQISNLSHNLVLGLTYLTVIRGSSPQIHYRNSIVGVIISNPTTTFLDATLGRIKVSWTARDTSMIGTYELKITFTRVSGGSTSKWTVTPISINVRKKY